MCCHQRIDPRFAHHLAIDAYFPDRSRVICVRKHGMFSTDRAMIADKADAIKTIIQALHHVEWLMLSSDQCSLPKEILWMEVAHGVMRIIHYKFGCSCLHCACDHSIYLVGKQAPPLF